jgi:hypothetical protein
VIILVNDIGFNSRSLFLRPVSRHSLWCKKRKTQPISMWDGRTKRTTITKITTSSRATPLSLRSSSAGMLPDYWRKCWLCCLVYKSCWISTALCSVAPHPNESCGAVECRKGFVNGLFYSWDGKTDSLQQGRGLKLCTLISKKYQKCWVPPDCQRVHPIFQEEFLVREGCVVIFNVPKEKIT